MKLKTRLNDTVEIVEALDNKYILLVNGYQYGGLRDHTTGCGTATFDSKAQAVRYYNTHETAEDGY
jgi:hypothetical protein